MTAYAFRNYDFTSRLATVHHLLQRCGGEKTSTREVRLYSRYRRTRVPAQELVVVDAEDREPVWNYNAAFRTCFDDEKRRQVVRRKHTRRRRKGGKPRRKLPSRAAAEDRTLKATLGDDRKESVFTRD